MRFIDSIALVLVILGWTSASNLSDPPKLMKNLKEDRINVQAGDNAKLVCPVNRQSTFRPIIEWYKEDEPINARTWKNYKQSQNYLIIKNVSKHDAGKFKCKATNGFGKLIVYMELTVQQVNDGSSQSKVDSIESKEERSIGVPLGQSKPSFQQKTRNVRKIIQRPAGSSIKLKCTPKGNPPPSVEWLKDGKILTPSKLNEVSKIRKYTLHLARLRANDSGKYMCRLTNTWGSVNSSYNIEVIEKILSKPILIGPHPKNNSVVEGGSASFLCQMRSETFPHIQWLKQVDFDPKHKNDKKIFHLHGKFYQVLDATEIIKRSDGVYMNKLVLKHVSEKNAGNYVCFGANNMGLSSREAHLIITKRNTLNQTKYNLLDGKRMQQENHFHVQNAPEYHSTTKTSKSSTLNVKLSVGFVFAALFILFFVFVVKRNFSKCTKSSTVNEPITSPHDFRITPMNVNGMLLNQSSNQHVTTYSISSLSEERLVHSPVTNCKEVYKPPSHDMNYWSHSDSISRGTSRCSEDVLDSRHSNHEHYFYVQQCK